MTNQRRIETYDLQQIYEAYFHDNISTFPWNNSDDDTDSCNEHQTCGYFCSIQRVSDIPGLEQRVKALISFEIEKFIEDQQRDFFGF